MSRRLETVGTGAFVGGVFGLGCLYILGILGFWGLIILALCKFVFGWSPF
jgi:hypothetical protein